MRKSIPSNYQIFDYWKDKKLEEFRSVIVDWGEPSCWACNKPIITENQELLDECNFKEIWNRTSGHLERCHIIPKSLGGSNEPENLFLMCPDCHKESPDTTNPELFFKWVRQQQKDHIMGHNYKKFNDEVNKYCDMYKVDSIELSQFMNTSDPNIISDKITSHFGKLSYSTFILAWIDEYLNRKKIEIHT